MNWIVRLWRSLLFAINAFRFHWRYGDGAVLKVETTELRPISTAIPPMDLEVVPEVVEVLEPQVTAEPMQITTVSHAPFFVVREGGQVCYEGASGGTARRCIESLREEYARWRTEHPGEVVPDKLRWSSLRDGKPWDWGPR